MDIALFVGFAAAGPLNRPVALENAGYFRSVFGDDLPLAWDPVRRETRCAHLGPAVRAFFREGGRRCWVVRVGAARQPAQFELPGLAQWEPTTGVPIPARAYARSQGSWFDDVQVATALTAQPVAALPLTAEGLDRLPVRLAARDEVVPGDLLRLSFGETIGQAWVLVESLAPADAGASPAREAVWWVQGRVLGPAPVLTAQLVPRIEKLLFELHARRGDGEIQRLTGLGFAPQHPRYWNILPDDDTLFGLPDLDRAVEAARAGNFRALWGEASEPGRFPLAGNGQRDAVFLPRDPSRLAEPWSRAVVTPDSALERDGLDALTAQLFLDPQLAAVGMSTLLAEVDSRRREPGSREGLTGIYTALDLDEVTLLAVPDAIHGGWQRVRSKAAPPAAFDPALAHASWALGEGCDEMASPPAGLEPRWDRFLRCGLRLLAVPELELSRELRGSGTYTLTWSSPDPEVTFVVQEATRPGFEDAVEHYRGTERSATVLGRAPGHYYYRVRAEAEGETSNWSPGVVVLVESGAGWELQPESEFDPGLLLDVHRALLRLCGARGDLLAVLALPEHYREDEALLHLARLRSRRDVSAEAGAKRTLPLGQGEVAALSHGAVYHPWLVSRDDASGRLEHEPPDAAACGLMARRTIERSAWSAPANAPFHGVVALAPPLSYTRQLDLLTAQLNQVLQAPAGFLTLNADTLGEDEEVRPINVRRLLMLLRRAALRQGMDYVFEANGPALRRAVQRDFESLLNELFVRGAFAGETRSTSYQVVTDDSLNTAQEADRGRFRVDLKVAPARPLSFVTVRLEQWGERGLASEIG